ncbi:hypothetical protein Q8G38_00055 [Halomonas venusta]|uniref:hypothetical protein n=1 Tax=Vreelandella venusta TaxID=44935 RepID=UPI00295E42DC|nr:hypothetical protein [Halomonas venusta]MDW0357701.1 hypothetical protein [Halomonas venusta]
MRYDSARSMIFQAYHEQRGSVMVYASQIAELGAQVQGTQKQNNDWRIVNGLESGQVISAVENQPQHLQALARYCFGPFTRDELAEDREWLHTALMHVGMQMRLPGQGQNERPSVEAVRQLRWIVSAAIHHHAETTYPYNRPGLHNPRRIAAWIEQEHGEEIEVRRWSAHGRTCWKGVWERLLDTLDRWECASLAPVAGLIVKAA